MLNVYVNYVLSLETGDVILFPKVYTSFRNASEDLDNTIGEYTKEKKVDKYTIVSKDDFNPKLMKTDGNNPGHYYFKKKISNAWIYKKVLVEGRLWNGSKLEKIGKIGVLPEINIPIDFKLVKLVNAVSEIGSNNNNNNNNSEINKKEINNENPESGEMGSSETLSIGSCYTEKTGKPSNYEHGNHVSFIHELKNKLQSRDTLLRKVNVNPVFPVISNIFTPSNFTTSISDAMKKLTHVTPPHSPDYGLGKVVETPLIRSNIEHDIKYIVPESENNSFSENNSQDNSQDNSFSENNNENNSFNEHNFSEFDNDANDLNFSKEFDFDFYNKFDNKIFENKTFDNKKIFIDKVVTVITKKLDNNSQEYSYDLDEDSSEDEVEESTESELSEQIVKIYDARNGKWEKYVCDINETSENNMETSENNMETSENNNEIDNMETSGENNETSENNMENNEDNVIDDMLNAYFRDYIYDTKTEEYIKYIVDNNFDFNDSFDDNESISESELPYMTFEEYKNLGLGETKFLSDPEQIKYL